LTGFGSAAVKCSSPKIRKGKEIAREKKEKSSDSRASGHFKRRYISDKQEKKGTTSQEDHEQHIIASSGSITRKEIRNRLQKWELRN